MSTAPSIHDAVESVSRALSDLGRSIKLNAKGTAHDVKKDVEASAKRARAELKSIRDRLTKSSATPSGRTRPSDVARDVKGRAKRAWKEITKPS